jgi:hypothetical protein
VFALVVCLIYITLIAWLWDIKKASVLCRGFLFNVVVILCRLLHYLWYLPNSHVFKYEMFALLGAHHIYLFFLPRFLFSQLSSQRP